MILNFPGGVKPDERTLIGRKPIDNINDCSIVCLPANELSRNVIENGTAVKRGSIIGETDGLPVYSPIAGRFNGISEIEGERYFVVINQGESGEERLFSPEENRLTDMTPEYISAAAKRFGIIDTRSGEPLYKLIDNAENYSRRLVIDCTEADPASAINYRLAIEKAKSAVGGAKILLRACGALKCVFAIEHYRGASFEAIKKFASDEKLFALAEMEEKYPYGDNALMYAIYLKTLKNGETANDNRVLIIGLETAVALYECMLNGTPWLDRYISVCGNGIEKAGNYLVPRGITRRDILKSCIKRENYLLIENSLLGGDIAKGALSDITRCLISVKPKKKPRTACIACGKCVDACPVGLSPNDILTSNSKDLKKNCTSCGACEYVCPSGIPLVRLIKRDNVITEEEYDI